MVFKQKCPGGHTRNVSKDVFEQRFMWSCKFFPLDKNSPWGDTFLYIFGYFSENEEFLKK